MSSSASKVAGFKPVQAWKSTKITFLSQNWFSSKISNEDSDMLMYKLLNWILFSGFVYKIS